MINVITKFFSNIFEALLLIIFIGIIILFSPIWVPIIIFWGLVSVYTKLWRILRNDPKPAINRQQYSGSGLFWNQEFTEEEFLLGLETAASNLSEYSKAKQSKIFIEKSKPYVNDLGEETIDYKISTILKSNNSELKINSLYRSNFIDGNERYYPECDNDCDGSDVLRVSFSIIKPTVFSKINFDLYSNEDFLLASCFLHNTVRFDKSKSQVWAYIEQYDSWLVKYDINKYDYGWRKKYTGNKASKYFFDKRST